MPTPTPELNDVPNIFKVRTQMVDGQAYVHMDDLAGYLHNEGVLLIKKHQHYPRLLARVFELLGIGCNLNVVRACADVLTQVANLVDRARRKVLADYEASLKEDET